MGLWDRITGQIGQQFLDVLQWLDDRGDTLVWRFPIADQAITDQSKLVVREGQSALFLDQGRLSEVFGPGTYTLDTPNSPIVSFFRSIAYGMQTPYKGDVLFVSTRQFTNNGWGTQNPFMMRDAEFGPVRVRAFGTYSFRVSDPTRFLREIVGTDGRFTTDEIHGQLKKQVVAAFTAAVAQAGVPVLDLAAHYVQLGDRIRKEMQPLLEAGYGLTLTDLTIGNISLPPEVEAALDQRTKMGVLGNLDAYAKLKAAEAVGDAARNPGLGGAGVGLGAGVALGQVVAGTLQNAASAQPPPPPLPSRLHYAGPSGQSEKTAAEIAAEVRKDPGARHLVWKPGMDAWKSPAEVPEVAALLSVPPPLPPAGPPPLPGDDR
jgi:membrane protease subunit (stomatin/prohibitin family)